MSNRFTRAVALAALTIGLSTSTAVAQNGSNFLLRSNGSDAIFGGIGAGGSSTGGAGGDGVGVWHCYEGMRGNSLTTLGDFGYKQISWRDAACVLGAPIVGLGIKFPQITVLEYDGVNPFAAGNVFTMPACAVPFGCFPLGNSAGIAPYGTPAGSSASFLVTGFATGVGLPSNAIAIIPNNGLLPSSNGGTAFVIAVASGTLGIASTGFCWGIQFGWLPSALPSLDDVNGWWMWRSNSPDNNQYWNLSDDETNIWQSQTVISTAGATALFALNANFEYDNDWLSSNASTNVALAPVGANGTGVYYATGAGVPNSGNSVNGGFDMGRHGGISTSGTGGTVSSLTGLGGQDPAGSPTAGLVPTMGAVTWSNGPSTTSPNFHLDWIQIWFDLTFGVDPALTTDLLVGPGGLFRVPVTLQASFPGAFPQPLTTAFFPFFIHTAADQSGQTAWPDPFGFPGGTFGIPPVVGSSIHLPVATSSVAIGLPVGLQAGTSRLKTAAGPFLWKNGPNANTPSQTHGIPLID